MSIKIAVIGAGSVEFTRKLVRDILCVPELADTAFSFIDINARNLDMITQLAERDIQANRKAGPALWRRLTAAKGWKGRITC